MGVRLVYGPDDNGPMRAPLPQQKADAGTTPPDSSSQSAPELITDQSNTEQQTRLEAGQSPASQVAIAQVASLGAANPMGQQTSPSPAVQGRQERTVYGVKISGEGVSPTAMDVVSRIVAGLAGHDEEIQARMAARKVRVVIIPAASRQTDLPEFAALKGTKTLDGREWDDVRGSGGSRFGSEMVVAVPEENLIAMTGHDDPYKGAYSVGSHEIAHAVQRYGMSSEQRAKVKVMYKRRFHGRGMFTDGYARANEEEYFAQGTNEFFGLTDTNQGPKWLKRNDPDLYHALVDVYGAPEVAKVRAASQAPPTPGAPGQTGQQ